MAIEKVINIKVNDNSEKTVSNLGKINKEQKKIQETTNETGNAFNAFSSKIDSLTGGMISKFKGLTSSLGGVSKGFVGIGSAIALSGLGLLVLVISSIIAAFKSSEEGQNKFAKLMGVIGSVVGNVMDVISDLGELIIGILSGDSAAIKSATAFGKKIFDVVGLPIKNIIDIVKTAGAVLGSLFSGDVDGALKALDKGIGDVKGNFKEASTAINEAKNSLKEFGEEALREAKIAQQIADQRANADKKERDLIVQRAEGDRKIAELREKAVERDKFSATQRIEFLKEAQAIETNLTNQEIAAAKLRADAKTKENKLTKSTKEDLMEEEQLKAKVIQLETSRLQGNRRLVSSIQSLQAEENATRKAAFEERKKEIKEEQKLKEEKIKKEIEDETKRQEAIQNIQKSYAQKIQDLEDTTELEKIERQKERALAELDALNASEEQKLELQKYYSQLINNEQEQLRIKKEQEDIEAEKNEKEKAKRQIEIEEMVKDAKIAIADNTLNLINEIAGKGSKVGKSIAVAQATISGIQGTQNAFTTASQSPITATFPAYPFIQSGLAGAFSLLQIKKILSTDASGKSSPSPTNTGGGGGGSSAPSFNLVAGTGTNQIAQSLAGQNQPLQAFVVGSAVTSQQELDRNQIDTASL
jgi:hypothetical protein